MQRDTEVYPQLRRARTPILFVHGRADNMVPFANARRLYNACETEKDFLFVDNVVHIETMLRAPEAYKAKLDAYINKYVL